MAGKKKGKGDLIVINDSSLREPDPKKKVQKKPKK